MAFLVPPSPFLAFGLEFLGVLATTCAWNTFPDSLIWRGWGMWAEEHFRQDSAALWAEFPGKYVMMGIPEITQWAKAEDRYTAVTVITSLLFDLDGPWGLASNHPLQSFRELCGDSSSSLSRDEESGLRLLFRAWGFLDNQLARVQTCY